MTDRPARRPMGGDTAVDGRELSPLGVEEFTNVTLLQL